MPIICIIGKVFRLTLMYVQSAGSQAQNVCSVYLCALNNIAACTSMECRVHLRTSFEAAALLLTAIFAVW
jgi:hypothetical protein